MQVLTSSEFKDYLSELLKDCEAFEQYLTDTNILDDRQRLEIIDKLRRDIKKRIDLQIKTITADETKNRENYTRGIENELKNVDFDEFERRQNPLLLWRKRNKSP